MTETGTNQCIK